MKQKVFVIGFQKTGTTSIEIALQKLGYKVFGGDKHLLNLKTEQALRTYIEDKLSKWDAVQDMPWPLVYKELYDVFPNAKYIYTVRDSKSWIRSVVHYFGSIRIPLHRKIYGVPCAEGYESRYLEIYEEHRKDVLNFFEGKKNFLIMDQNKNFNYQTLCGFLETINVPLEPFPHARNNSNRNLPNYKIYRSLRSLYWNIKKNY